MVPEIAGPLARVFLRYAGGALMSYAGFTLDLNDPDVNTVATFAIGALISAGTEGWWYLARKYNWCQ